MNFIAPISDKRLQAVSSTFAMLLVGRQVFALLQRLLGHLIDLAVDILQHLEKQQFFGREVFIEQSLRDARPPR